MSFAIVLALAALAEGPAQGPPPAAPTGRAPHCWFRRARRATARPRSETTSRRRARTSAASVRTGSTTTAPRRSTRAPGTARSSAFRQVIELKGRRADAALYWMAYARNKQGQGGEALAAVEELRRAYPQSRWLKEAGALELEIRQRAGQPPGPESVADEDLKLMALNGLLNSDPEQAIPLLEKFLQGNSSRKLQERALFVLCQSSSPKAREIVTRVARGESQPDLQRRAIQSLGVFGNPESRQVLAEIYAVDAPTRA